MAKRSKFPDWVRIGACTDYLLGLPIEAIERKWKISQGLLYYWIRRTGSFSLRQAKIGKSNGVAGTYPRGRY